METVTTSKSEYENLIHKIEVLEEKVGPSYENEVIELKKLKLSEKISEKEIMNELS